MTVRLSLEEFDSFRERAALRGMTTSALLRELLGVIPHAKSDDSTRVLLSEILAMRAITINMLHKLGANTVLTVDTVNEIIRQADREKTSRAEARL